jgi:hypothetical protein
MDIAYTTTINLDKYCFWVKLWDKEACLVFHDTWIHLRLQII